MQSVEELKKTLKASDAGKEARIDIRLDIVHKLFLKQVCKPAGYKSLSAFMIQAALDKAQAIVEKENTILASERDKSIFFNALLETQGPNEALNKATASFKEALK